MRCFATSKKAKSRRHRFSSRMQVDLSTCRFAHKQLRTHTQGERGSTYRVGCASQARARHAKAPPHTNSQIHATVATRHGGPWTLILRHGSFVAAVPASVDASPSQRLFVVAVSVAVQSFHGGFPPPLVVCLHGGCSFFSFALGLGCQGGSDLLICGRDRTFSSSSCQGAEERPRSPAFSSSD